MKGSLDEENISINDRNKILITAKQTSRVYIVNYISKRMYRTKIKDSKAVPTLIVSDEDHTSVNPRELATTKDTGIHLCIVYLIIVDLKCLGNFTLLLP